MGKAARLKANRRVKERAVGKRLDAVAWTPTDPAPIEMLQEAVIAIGDVFGSVPACVEAAALLHLAAAELGYELGPRPVSVLAHAKDSGNIAFMGPKASAMIPPEAHSRVEDLRPSGIDNGHLVLTCESPSLLLDANIRQLSVMEIDAPSIMLRIRSTTPASGEWSAAFGDLEILYILDEDNRALMTNWGEIVDMHRGNATQLVEMLNLGMSADDISRVVVRRDWTQEYPDYVPR
ncbi:MULTISPECIES: hypothetical protein [Actinomycetes]|uniref:hypothetical protein n=1 Tax=Actinomycetes TaxID=1760 RepID=UPI0010A7B13F|nr:MULTISPECIES: hypothetical protein [Actinomycetes]